MLLCAAVCMPDISRIHRLLGASGGLGNINQRSGGLGKIARAQWDCHVL